MSKTHYEVLGVNELAGAAKIKRHYYELCKKHHPDVAGGDSQKMTAINEAYRVLSDATLKSAYDRELTAQRREAAFARAAQRDATTQPIAQEPSAFRGTVKTTSPQKKSGWAWFMAFGGIAALAIIVVGYAMPIPKAASATTDAPTVATNDTSADTQASSGMPTNPMSDKAAQDALQTLESETAASSAEPTPPSTPPNTTGPTSGNNISQTTPHKHHRPISFWFPQSND